MRQKERNNLLNLWAAFSHPTFIRIAPHFYGLWRKGRDTELRHFLSKVEEGPRKGIAVLFAKRGTIFAKRAAIWQTRCIFTAKGGTLRTVPRPSKCSTFSTKVLCFLREKAARFTPFFQVPPSCICCILFDMYRTYSTSVMKALECKPSVQFD